MEERVLAASGHSPDHAGDRVTPPVALPVTSSSRTSDGPGSLGTVSPWGSPSQTRIDLVAAERIASAVERLMAAVPHDASPVPVRRWLMAAERLLPLAGEHDRARLLQARAGVRAAAGSVAGAATEVASGVVGEAVGGAAPGRAGLAMDGALSDTSDSAELFERLGDPLAAAANFAAAASAAARDGLITVALETAVRALVALGAAVRSGDRADRDPVAEAHLAARLGALCRQLFDYPRALRFYELALDAAPGHDLCAPVATLAVAELLLAQVSELPAGDPKRAALLHRAERMAGQLLALPGPEPFRRVHSPRLLADIRCEQGKPGQAWPLLLDVHEALADPDDAGLAGPVHLSSGRCLLLLGKFPHAVAELDRAVAALEAPSDQEEPHLAELLAALRLRSAAREGAGDLTGAIADARRLAALLAERHRRHVGGFMDQVWSRAGAEEERRDLRERTVALLATAEQDPLTGLANRRALDRFREQLGPGGEVSLVLIDIDHFKTVNDRLGHAVGDDVLRTLAGLMTRSVRTMDLVARWGGEEFLIALPGGSRRLGADAAERVCRRVRTHPWRQVAEGLAVTASAGVASGPVTELDVVLARADAALYTAKRSGRDQVVLARPS